MGPSYRARVGRVCACLCVCVVKYPNILITVSRNGQRGAGGGVGTFCLALFGPPPPPTSDLSWLSVIESIPLPPNAGPSIFVFVCRHWTGTRGLGAVSQSQRKAVQQGPGSRWPSVFVLMGSANGERGTVVHLEVHIPAIAGVIGLF